MRTNSKRWTQYNIFDSGVQIYIKEIFKNKPADKAWLPQN